MKFRIGFDIDGVLGDFMAQYQTFFNQLYPGENYNICRLSLAADPQLYNAARRMKSLQYLLHQNTPVQPERYGYAECFRKYTLKIYIS